MNGIDSKGLDEDAFGDKGSLSGLKTFDAFREYTKPVSKTIQRPRMLMRPFNCSQNQSLLYDSHSPRGTMDSLDPGDLYGLWAT